MMCLSQAMWAVVYSKDLWKRVDSFFFHFALSATKHICSKRPVTSPRICGITLTLIGSMLLNCGSTYHARGKVKGTDNTLK